VGRKKKAKYHSHLQYKEEEVYGELTERVRIGEHQLGIIEVSSRYENRKQGTNKEYVVR